MSFLLSYVMKTCFSLSTQLSSIVSVYDALIGSNVTNAAVALKAWFAESMRGRRVVGALREKAGGTKSTVKSAMEGRRKASEFRCVAAVRRDRAWRAMPALTRGEGVRVLVKKARECTASRNHSHHCVGIGAVSAGRYSSQRLVCDLDDAIASAPAAPPPPERRASSSNDQ